MNLITETIMASYNLNRTRLFTTHGLLLLTLSRDYCSPADII